MCTRGADYSDLMSFCVMLLLLVCFFVELESFLSIMVTILSFDGLTSRGSPSPSTFIAHGFSSFFNG